MGLHRGIASRLDCGTIFAVGVPQEIRTRSLDKSGLRTAESTYRCPVLRLGA